MSGFAYGSATSSSMCSAATSSIFSGLEAPSAAVGSRDGALLMARGVVETFGDGAIGVPVLLMGFEPGSFSSL